MLSGKTMDETAEACGISSSELADIETNRVGPTGEVLRSLERFFRGSQFVTGDSTLTEVRRRRLPGTEIDWIGLALRAEATSNRELVSEVATRIRELRGLPPGATVHMRETEAHLLISMLDTRDPDCAKDVSYALALALPQAEILLTDAAATTARRLRAMRMPSRPDESVDLDADDVEAEAAPAS